MGDYGSGNFSAAIFHEHSAQRRSSGDGSLQYTYMTRFPKKKERGKKRARNGNGFSSGKKMKTKTKKCTRGQRPLPAPPLCRRSCLTRPYHSPYFRTRGTKFNNNNKRGKPNGRNTAYGPPSKITSILKIYFTIF